MGSQKEINKLIAAGVVNREFKKKLLNPETRIIAINDGYGGESFDITPAEEEKLLAIKATTLPEFAEKIVTDFRD